MFSPGSPGATFKLACYTEYAICVSVTLVSFASGRASGGARIICTQRSPIIASISLHIESQDGGPPLYRRQRLLKFFTA